MVSLRQVGEVFHLAGFALKQSASSSVLWELCWRFAAPVPSLGGYYSTPDMLGTKEFEPGYQPSDEVQCHFLDVARTSMLLNIVSGIELAL